MLSSLLMIKDAIVTRVRESNQERVDFKRRQDMIFNEGLIVFKLREQLNKQILFMRENDEIESMKVKIAPEGLPFLETIVKTLNCDFELCANPDEIYLIKVEDYL